MTQLIEAGTYSHAYSTFYSILYASLTKSRNVSHDDAEDIIQEVFASIWYNRHTWTVREIRPYLFAAVRKQYYRFLYNNRRETDIIERYSFNPPHRDLPESSDFAVLMDESLSRLNKELESWSGRTREVFNLYYHHEMNSLAIARTLNLSEHQVKREMTKLTTAITNLLIEHPTSGSTPHSWGVKYFANPTNNVPPEIIKRYLKRFPIMTWEDFEARYINGRQLRSFI